MRPVVSFGIGLLFGIGLIVSGMSNPAKVLNFLDLAAIPAGTWDASLALVMIGAVSVGLLGFGLVLGWQKPLLAERFWLPSARGIDRRILIGPAIFGIGWGLAGFCPGPALVGLGAGSSAALVFIGTMILGMGAARRL
ncbi:DUF6691 family protein [Elstera sp.]|jgi:uncharacterized membrane protein YedE/YeeE|uniref:DUF6691 family protein n=1 Tax=Elstera sp. TaxID=1916664 RepID=UPI0037BF3BAA